MAAAFEAERNLRNDDHVCCTCIYLNRRKNRTVCCWRNAPTSIDNERVLQSSSAEDATIFMKKRKLEEL